MLTATLNYTPTLIRSAAFAYLRRGMGAGTLVGLLVLAVVSAVMTYSDRTSWFIPAVGGASAMLILMLFAFYQVHFRQGMAKLQRMGEPRAVLTLTDTEFQVRTGVASSSMPWSTFTALWRFSAFWLLIIGNGQYLTLPLKDLSPEAQEFIAARVKPTAA